MEHVSERSRTLHNIKEGFEPCDDELGASDRVFYNSTEDLLQPITEELNTFNDMMVSIFISAVKYKLEHF